MAVSAVLNTISLVNQKEKKCKLIQLILFLKFECSKKNAVFTSRPTRNSQGNR